MEVFVPLVGQYDNIGDTMHRSVLLDWLEPVGPLHLYIGSATDSFVTGLKLPPGALVYRNIAFWLWRAITAQKRSAFVFNPGEISGRTRRVFKELVLLPVLLRFRARGAPVLKVGVAYRKRSTASRTVIKAINAFTTYTFYRTRCSHMEFGKGEVVPDLALDLYEGPSENNKYIVLSFRGDRYERNETFLSAIVDFAFSERLKVAVVSQVRSDNGSTRDIASSLMKMGCDVHTVGWDDQTTHADQERILNDIYADTAIAVSDRLHVLLASANFGAVPAGAATYYSEKVKAHFDVMGVHDIVFDHTWMEKEVIVSRLRTILSRKGDIHSRLRAAKERLGRIRADMLNTYFWSTID